MSRQEVLHGWLQLVRQVMQWHLITTGSPFVDRRLLQKELPEPCWSNVENFVRALKGLPLWVNRDLALTAFGGKQNYDYWHSVFESGKSPDGARIMESGIDVVALLQGT